MGKKRGMDRGHGQAQEIALFTPRGSGELGPKGSQQRPQRMEDRKPPFLILQTTDKLPGLPRDPRQGRRDPAI